MKRIIYAFICLMIAFCLVSCNEKDDKININFIIEGKSYVVEIDKGTSISKDIIPLNNGDEVIELYYDEKMENKYNKEIINNDLIIYVNKMPEDLAVMISNAKNDFFEQYNGELFIKKCYGMYENSIFFSFMEKHLMFQIQNL